MRRQELPLCAPVRGRGRGGGRHDALRVRVPGPEVLRLLAHLRPGVAVAARQGGTRGQGGGAQGRRRQGVRHLHGRGHRQEELRQDQGVHRRGQGQIGRDQDTGGREMRRQVIKHIRFKYS